jgi:hypothetical protein
MIMEGQSEGEAKGDGACRRPVLAWSKNHLLVS